jgi:hypothetical protein
MVKRLISDKQREAIGKVSVSFIKNLTESQIDTYIDNQVTSLATAKEVMKKMAKLILYILKYSNLQR